MANWRTADHPLPAWANYLIIATAFLVLVLVGVWQS